MKEKIKIMKTPPPVTEEEIQNFMDFNTLLKMKDNVDRGRRNARRARNFFTCFVAALSIPVLISFWPVNNADQGIDLSDSVQAQIPRSVADGSSVTPDSAANKRARIPVEAQDTTRRKVATGPDTPSRPAEPTANPAAKAREIVVQPTYVQAEPIDGYPALYAYFNRNLIYPADAVKDSIEGVVTVVFTLDSTGTAKNIQVENSLGILFDKEVIRLIRNMPLWKPATYNGKPVPARISLPVTFQLKKTSNL